MSKVSTRVRLEYLDDAARKIHSTAPTVASALEAEHNRLTLDQSHKKLGSPPKDDQICLACGNLFDFMKNKSDSDAQLATAMSKSARRRLRARKLSENLNEAKAAIKAAEKNSSLAKKKLICQRCHRITVLRQYDQPAGPTRQLRVAAQMQDSSSSIPPAAPPNSAQIAKARTISNTSSKKRAKARKQGGLQAILAKSKATPESSSGLDLMDFMSNN